MKTCKTNGIGYSGVATCLAAMALAAAPAAAQHQVRMTQPKIAVEMPPGKDSVRLPLQTMGDHILLSIAINGSQPLPIVLDTGMPMAGLALFDTEEVRALNLEYSPMRARVGGAGGDGEHMEAKVAQGVTMNLGGISFTDTMALVMPSMQHFAAHHAGVIGLAVFDNFAVTFDYDAGEIVLTRPDAFTPPADAARVPLELKDNLPYVQAAATTGDGPETPVDLVLDLGAGHNLSLNTSSNDNLQVPAGAIPSRLGRGLSGAIHGSTGRIPSFTLGGYTLKGMVTSFPDARFENPRGIDSLDGNLGIGVMNRFDFTLDYATRTLYLKPNKRFAEPFEWGMSGLTLEAGEQGGLAVEEIVPGSPADAAGLQVGDVVLALNGQEVSADDRFRVRDMLRAEGAEISVRYRRGDDVASASFTLRRLI